MDINDTRPSEFATLLKWIDEAAARKGVSLIGVSGYGGIGKSYLLNEALRHQRLSDRGYCEIRIDGSDRSILGDFMKMLELKFSPIKFSAASSERDYFPRIRKLSRAHRALEKQIEKEISKKDATVDAKQAATAIFRGGTLLNKAIPKSKDYLDFDYLKTIGADRHIDDAFQVVSSLRSLSNSSWVPGVLKDYLGVTYQERLRRDFFGLAADEYISDLTAALSGYRSNDLFRLTQAKIKGRNALLLVLDDFEILGKTISEFTVANLIPALDQSAFPTIMIILGRDDMQDSNIGFQHHHAQRIIGKIRLEKLPLDVAHRMFRSAGYGDEDATRMSNETQGYPFLVASLCESKERTVTFYQRFFDRTTRWMADREKQWVVPLAYLDRITEESVAGMIPRCDPKQVMEWFKTEASLRDPNASWYVISAFIKNMLLEYNLRTIGETKHTAMLEQARKLTNNPMDRSGGSAAS